jgi:hypothetical protein
MRKAKPVGIQIHRRDQVTNLATRGPSLVTRMMRKAKPVGIQIHQRDQFTILVTRGPSLVTRMMRKATPVGIQIHQRDQVTILGPSLVTRGLSLVTLGPSLVTCRHPRVKRKKLSNPPVAAMVEGDDLLWQEKEETRKIIQLPCDVSQR